MDERAGSVLLVLLHEEAFCAPKLLDICPSAPIFELHGRLQRQRGIRRVERVDIAQRAGDLQRIEIGIAEVD
jgi:hypothetical protein